MSNGTYTTDQTPSPPKKKLTARAKFLGRIKRAGKLKELNNRVREMKNENGKTWNVNLWAACREFGYIGPENEHKLHAEYEAQMKAEQDAVIQEKVDAVVQQIQSAKTFEEALTKLPVSAEAKAENDWILAHPAMARKARQKNNLEPVLITAADILEANHGPAPSRAAAIKLQHWANKPDEIFKALTGSVKKAPDSVDRPEEVAEVEDLAEIDRLLKEVG